jgi:hypothetical protein
MHIVTEGAEGQGGPVSRLDYERQAPRLPALGTTEFAAEDVARYGLVNSRIYGRSKNRALNGRMELERPEVEIRGHRVDVVIKRRQEKIERGSITHRGVIRMLSAGARRRMVFSARNVAGLKNLLTLTYPGEFSQDGRRVKRDLAAIRKWLTRRGLAGWWFLEFQERGAPHFHVFLTGECAYREVSEAWYRIVGSGDERHLRAGTRIERVRCEHAASAYAAKESSKMAQKQVPAEYRSVGRFWGLFGGLRPEIEIQFRGTMGELAGLIRLCRRARDAKRRAVWVRTGGARGRRVKDRGRRGLTLWDVGETLSWMMERELSVSQDSELQRESALDRLEASLSFVKQAPGDGGANPLGG